MRFLKSLHRSTLTDEQIIAHYRTQNDAAWIGVLFERYSHLIYAVSLNYLKNEEEAKDAVIQIFFKLNQDLVRYEIKLFSAWIHTVTRNYCLKQLAVRRNNLPLNEALLSSEEETNEEEANSQFLKELPAAIDRLNQEQKLCVELFYLRELSYKEISDQTGYTLNQVKSFIQNGKRNLKLILMKTK